MQRVADMIIATTSLVPYCNNLARPLLQQIVRGLLLCFKTMHR